MKKISLFMFLFVTFSLAAQRGSPPGGGRPAGGASSPGGNLLAIAEKSTQQLFTTVGGRLTPSKRIVHKTNKGGIIQEIFVELGDRVKTGQKLFSISQNEPGVRYLPVVVESRTAGVVSEILLQHQDEVNVGTPGVIILNTDTLSLEAAVSDLDVFFIKEGIQVEGVNPKEETFSGTLENVSAEPDYETGLFTLTFNFPFSPGIQLGMYLFIEIPAQEFQGIFVPPEAIVRRYGKNIIWTVQEDKTLSPQNVGTGSQAAGMVRINQGLEPGTSYLTSPTGKEKEGMSLKEILPQRTESEENND